LVITLSGAEADLSCASRAILAPGSAWNFVVAGRDVVESPGRTRSQAGRMSAKIPANDGDPAEVPPIAVRVLSLALNPLVQLLGIGGGKPT
jgi:hypothetical protein